MDVIYSLIPGMMFFGLIFLAVLIWAVKKGQYEDMEGNASRILFDDDTMIYPDKTTSHSTRLSKDDSQVAGYDKTIGETTSHLTNPAQDAGQVIGYSHSTWLSKDDSLVAGYDDGKNDEADKENSDLKQP